MTKFKLNKYRKKKLLIIQHGKHMLIFLMNLPHQIQSGCRKSKLVRSWMLKKKRKWWNMNSINLWKTY